MNCYKNSCKKCRALDICYLNIFSWSLGDVIIYLKMFWKVLKKFINEVWSLCTIDTLSRIVISCFYPRPLPQARYWQWQWVIQPTAVLICHLDRNMEENPEACAKLRWTQLWSLQVQTLILYIYWLTGQQWSRATLRGCRRPSTRRVSTPTWRWTILHLIIFYPLPPAVVHWHHEPRPPDPGCRAGQDRHRQTAPQAQGHQPECFCE